ncbi:MAG: hypothetical protein RBR81_11025 [Bacteroidales bacterium]|jgi:hypothetical protein|nr:hypothetical protein [Bacteroidales bacterium]
MTICFKKPQIVANQVGCIYSVPRSLKACQQVPKTRKMNLEWYKNSKRDDASVERLKKFINFTA